MKTAKPVHGRARLVVTDERMVLIINDVGYEIVNQHPDVRIATPAYKLVKGCGTSYTVHTDQWGSHCDCGHFQWRSSRTGDPCKHILSLIAVKLLPPANHEKIDQRQEREIDDA